MQTAVWVAVCLSMIGLARAADVTNVARKRIQLGPQELGAALQKFGELEGLHIVFLSEDVQNRHTSGVSGSLTYAEALEQLLRGTDLTYRFLETLTVMILPASGMPGAPVEPKSASGSEDDARKGIVASIDAGTPARQVTITAARQSDAQQLEYFRLLSAMSRSEYKRLVKTLPFVDVGTVHFPGGKGPEGRLPLGQHIQAGGVDGLVVWRVINLTRTKAESELQVHNSNSFPVFVEIGLGRTKLGAGPNAALAPGETAIWNFNPTPCPGGMGYDGLSGSTHALAEAACNDYPVRPGTAHVRMLKEWDPGPAHSPDETDSPGVPP